MSFIATHSHLSDFLIQDVLHLGFRNWDIYSMSKVVTWFTFYLFWCGSVIKVSHKEILRCLFTFVAVAMLSTVIVCAVGHLPQHRYCSLQLHRAYLAMLLRILLFLPATPFLALKRFILQKWILPAQFIFLLT